MKKPGKELNLAISQEVLGYTIAQQKGVTMEATPKGVRPLKSYSTDIAAAWEVAEKLAITLIPIENGSWFAFVGQGKGWTSPAEFLSYLGEAKFDQSGAAVAESAPLSICLAAMTTLEKKQSSELPGTSPGAAIH